MFGASLLAPTSRSRVTQAFKQFSKKTQTMYMGSVDQSKSEYHLVRGFTASHTHADTDHCVGAFLHHDFVLLHRDTKPGRVIITEVDLHTIHPFSHFFVIPNSLEPRWFDTILKLYPHHRHAPFAPHDTFHPQFKDTHSVLSLPTHFEKSLFFAADDVAKCMLNLQSNGYVLEVKDHSMFLYNFEPNEPSEHLLDVQVRFACTLASALEARNK